jgi:RNA polymerase sigma-70 factor (ECF subfamily)
MTDEMASEYSVEVPIRRPASAGEPALVARAAAGDHEAYAALVRPHQHVAYRVAVAITGWSAGAEEAVQNAHVKAYRSLDRFRRDASFRPWLLGIVVHEAHNALRAERRHERLAVRATARHETPRAAADEAVLAREEVETVLEALRRLSDADRLTIALRYFAQLSDAEAAGLVGASPAAFRLRVLRARRRLGALLEEADA